MSKYNLIILTAAIFLLTGVCTLRAQQKIIAYYVSWSNTPAVDKVEFSNLTHIVMAFAWPDSIGGIGLSYGLPNTDMVTAAHNAGKKILLSFTNVDSIDGFGKVLSDSSIRSNFINNIVTFLQSYKYDGIDIDWEYPTTVQSSQLTELVKEIRQKFSSTNSSWLLTMAVPPNPYYGQYYQCENMEPYIDWYNLLTYNFHGFWSAHSGHVAPLFSSQGDVDGDDSSSVQYYLTTRKISASKIMLGIAFYGMEFNTKGLYKVLLNKTVPTLVYSAIMDTISSGNWVYNWDSVAEVPYYTTADSTKLISFDDTVSVRLKTEYAIHKGLGGVMVWALGLDLVKNTQPLIESIGNTIRDYPSAVVSGKSITPSSFYLFNNYPNPFNPSTTIMWRLSRGTHVTLKVYDTLGSEIASLVNEYQKAGMHSIVFNPSISAIKKNLASGIYFYRLTAGDYYSAKKMMILK